MKYITEYFNDTIKFNTNKHIINFDIFLSILRKFTQRNYELNNYRYNHDKSKTRSNSSPPQPINKFLYPPSPFSPLPPVYHHSLTLSFSPPFPSLGFSEAITVKSNEARAHAPRVKGVVKNEAPGELQSLGIIIKHRSEANARARADEGSNGVFRSGGPVGLEMNVLQCF